MTNPEFDEAVEKMLAEAEKCPMPQLYYNISIALAQAELERTQDFEEGYRFRCVLAPLITIYFRRYDAEYRKAQNAN